MGFFDDEKTETPAEGLYACKVEDCSLDETKPDPVITVRYRLHTGQAAWQRFVVKDSTRKWLSWQLGVLGVWKTAKENCQDPHNFSLVARSILEALGKIIGQYFEGEISHREYNEKTYTDLKIERALTNEQAKIFKQSVASKKQDEPPKMDLNEELPF
jgi:hypothetical protein